MYVVMSNFRVANGLASEVRTAFLNRPHKVDHEDGFVRMEVMQPVEQPEDFWLTTYWRDRESWERWYRSHSYKDSHSGMPPGLKLDPTQTEIRHFELFAE